MNTYKPSILDNDLDYINKIQEANTWAGWRERESALLEIREHYLNLAEKTEDLRWTIKDPAEWKNQGDGQGRYIQGIIMHNILTSPNSDICKNDISELLNISNNLQTQSRVRSDPTQKSLAEKFQETKYAFGCVSMIPQTMVDLLHRATLGHYDPKLSIQENKEIAQNWISKKKALLDKPSSQQTLQMQ